MNFQSLFFSRTCRRLALLAIGAMGCFLKALAQSTAPQFPPPPPPVVPVPSRAAEPLRTRVPTDVSPTLYSIGEPTDDEQVYLELINRARANPTAEGTRLRAATDPDVLRAGTFFGVDLVLLTNQFAAIAPAPPLAFSPRLIASARLHCGDMFTNVFQGHISTDGRTLGDRAGAQGYQGALAENIFAYATTAFHGHAGFEVDWGPGLGGMQTPPGHRITLHNPAFREIGVGVVNGANSKTVGGVTFSVGPQLVTQDLGVTAANTPLLTGVAYYDLNTNGFYDAGEGIGGITVSVGNANFYAVTAGSGGYTVPLPGNGTYPVTFSAPGLAPTQRTVSVTGLANVKADLIPRYTPPQVAGVARAFLNRTNDFEISPVGGATGYRVEQTRLVPFTASEGAENGTSGVLLETSPGYSVISTAVKASGKASFQLAMPAPNDQSLTLAPTLRLAATSQLTFASRLRYASPNQVARAQITTDAGASWQDVWTQAGTDTSGDAAFVKRTISLAGFAGSNARVRFAYTFATGSYYPQTSATVGFFVDDIAVGNAQEVRDTGFAEVSAGALSGFNPTNAATYSLRVQARLGARLLPFGPATDLVVVNAPATQLRTVQPVGADQVRFDIGLAGGTAGTLVIESAVNVGGPWTIEPAAVLQTVRPDSAYQVTAPRAGGQRYFRVRVLP